MMTNRFSKVLRDFLRQLRATEEIKHIGEDHLGNVYYESTKSNDPRGARRFFKNNDVDEGDPLVSVGKIPALWDAWLRFRRDHPPTLEEIESSQRYFDIQQALAGKAQQKPNVLKPGEYPRLVIKKKPDT